MSTIKCINPSQDKFSTNTEIEIISEISVIKKNNIIEISGNTEEGLFIIKLDDESFMKMKKDFDKI